MSINSVSAYINTFYFLPVILPVCLLHGCVIGFNLIKKIIVKKIKVENIESNTFFLILSFLFIVLSFPY